MRCVHEVSSSITKAVKQPVFYHTSNRFLSLFEEPLMGQDLYNTWTYRKIVPMQLIEFILDWADKDGNRIDPIKMGLPPDMPRDVRHVVTFKAVGNKTEMTVTEYGYTSDQIFDLSLAGLNECLDKMAASLM
jgi:hypothetical protein